MIKALASTAFMLLSVQLAWADCTELNRQALPKKVVFQAAVDEYKNSTASHLRDLINNKEQPEIVAIAEGVVAASKVIAAMDDMISYLHAVMAGGCFGKEASGWAAASGTACGRTAGCISTPSLLWPRSRISVTSEGAEICLRSSSAVCFYIFLRMPTSSLVLCIRSTSNFS